MLEVKPDGTLVPKKPGTTRIRFVKGELSDSHTITVVEELPEHVNLSLRIKVPADGRNSPYLLIGKLKLARLTEGNGYGGNIKLPRDIAFRFRITTDKGVQEAKRDGNAAPFRILKLPNDAAIEYEVERWSE